MNIVYIVSDGLSEYNSSQFRVSLIGDALRRAGHIVTILNIRQWLDQTEECRLACAKSDIIHLQRVLVNDTHNIIKHWTSLGKAVVADWDDAYDMILPSNAAADFWLHGKVTIQTASGYKFDKILEDHPVNQFQNGLKLCTAGITPSETLSKDWRHFAPTFVVKNYIDVTHYRESQMQIDTDYIVFGWGGSLSHTQSWEKSGIQEAFRQLLIDRDDARLMIIGDERVVKSLPIRRDKILFHPYVPWRNWAKMLSYFDVGLAPLAGEYDDRRSALKVTEYVTIGKPFIATKSPVYNDFRKVNSGKFIDGGDDAENQSLRADQWYQSAIDIMDNLSEYKKRAIVNMSIGDDWDADSGVSTVEETYRRIIKLAKQNAGK